jgi:hypothetical protein
VPRSPGDHPTESPHSKPRSPRPGAHAATLAAVSGLPGYEQIRRRVIFDSRDRAGENQGFPSELIAVSYGGLLVASHWRGEAQYGRESSALACVAGRSRAVRCSLGRRIALVHPPRTGGALALASRRR